MKISVIVPIYNSGKLLSKCIDSIINQTYKNLEIILVNDGSNDDITLSICIEYKKKDDRITLINNSNHGVSYSRNCGIEIATGDYITFVDADDYLELDCFEKILKYIKKDYDFIRYNLKHINGKKYDNLYSLENKDIMINESSKKELLTHFLTNEENIPCFVWLLLVKKDIVKKIKFNEKLIIMEDTDYYLKLLNISKKCIFLDLRMYNYYINPKSAMHNQDYYEKNIFGIIDTHVSIMQQINELKKDELFLKKINSQHLTLIYGFLVQLYNANPNKYKKIVNRLCDNSVYRSICNNYSKLTLKNKLLNIFINNKLYFFQYLLLRTTKIIKKIYH